jgi:arylamine N-acetyltransferase
MATPPPPSTDWTMRYLALLDQPHAAPSVAALTALVRAHVLAIAFENVTALMRRQAHGLAPVPAPDPEQILQMWEQRAGGGACFEIAMMFARLLNALGYQAHMVLGQISLPYGHQAALVELDGARYLVDLGNGAPIFEPLLLSYVPVEVHRHGLSFRFLYDVEANEALQDRMIDGEWNTHCRYTLQPAVDAHREQGYQHHHTPNASWVTGTLTIVRSTEQEAYSLRDQVLTRHTAWGKTAETITDPARFKSLAAETFAMPNLPIQGALEVRARFAALDASSSTVR